MCRWMGGPNWCIGSPSRLTKRANESPCFSMPMRWAKTGTRLSGLAPPGRPRPPTRNSMSLTRTSFSARCCQLDHARTVQRGDGLLGIILEILANDEHCLAIPVTCGVGKGNVGGERNIARHLLPQITKLIPRVPHVVTGGVDGVLPSGGVVTGAARHQSAANVRLALEDADRRIEVLARPVEVRGWRHLHVVCGTRLSPSGGGAGACAWSRCGAIHSVISSSGAKRFIRYSLLQAKLAASLVSPVPLYFAIAG